MPSLTGSDLLDALRRNRLLDAAKLDSLARDPIAANDPMALARELLRRDWLTPYQANQLLQGHGDGLVLGPYVLLERLGAGGMGQVFKARHGKLSRVVALKVIRKDRLINPDVVRRFLREIRLAAQLSHPNVIVAFDAEECAGTHLLAMEYVEGTDLARLLKQHGPLPVRQACDYVRQAALGLQHAFERGLVHRDIKPSNLLLSTRDGSVKLLDLGLARQERPSVEDSGALTEEGLLMGTPDYMAPEQIEESRFVDIRADIYSLGCTLYHLLAGRPPFGGESAGKKLAAHLTLEPTAIEALRPDLPPGLGAVLRTMMAKQPQHRYATPAEAAQALLAVLQGVPPAVPALPPPAALPAIDPFADLQTGDTIEGGQTSQQRRRLPRRREWLWGLAGLAVLAGLLVLLWYTFWPHPPQPAPAPEDTLSPLDRLRAEQIPAVERFDGQPPELVAVLGSHGLRHNGENAAVHDVAIAPDGATVASIGDNGTLKLWVSDTGRERTGQSLGGTPTAVAFDRFGRRLALCITSGGVRILSWNGVRLSPLFELSDPSAMARAVFSNSDHLLAAAGYDGRVRVWDLRDAPPKAVVLEAHAKRAVSVAFSSDDRSLYSAGENGLICSWRHDGQKWVKDRTWRQELPLKDLVLASDDRTLATAAKDGWVLLWDVKSVSAKPRVSFQVRTRECNGLAFSSDGKTLACGEQQHVSLWTDLDQVHLAEDVTLEASINHTYRPAFSKDGNTLAAGTSDNSVRLWRRDGKNWKPHLPPQGHTDPIMALAFAPDGSALVSGSLVSSLYSWNLTDAGFAAPRFLGYTPGGVRALRFAPDGRTLAAGSSGALQLWDPAASGPEARRAQLCQDTPSAIAFTPDGRTIAGAFGATGVGIWLLGDADPSAPVWLKGHDKAVNGVALSPRGRKLASAGSDGFVRLWSGTGKRWTQLGNGLQHPRSVTAVSFNADASMIISACDDGMLRLWDVAEMKPHTPALLEPRCPGPFLAVFLPSDGKTLAVISSDRRLIWWDTATWSKRGELRLPLVPRSLTLSADGRHAAVGNDNGTIHVYRLGSARP